MGRRTRAKVGPFIPKIYARELRKELDLSMVEVLERLAARGVVMTEASLSRIERSLQPADTPALHALAQVLEVPIATLMTGIKPDAEGIEHLYERLVPRDRAVARRMMEEMAPKDPSAPSRAKKS